MTADLLRASKRRRRVGQPSYGKQNEIESSNPSKSAQQSSKASDKISDLLKSLMRAHLEIDDVEKTTRAW